MLVSEIKERIRYMEDDDEIICLLFPSVMVQTVAEDLEIPVTEGYVKMLTEEVNNRANDTVDIWSIIEQVLIERHP